MGSFQTLSYGPAEESFANKKACLCRPFFYAIFPQTSSTIDLSHCVDYIDCAAFYRNSSNIKDLDNASAPIILTTKVIIALAPFILQDTA